MAFTKDHVRPKIYLNGFEHGSSKWNTLSGEATDGITAYSTDTPTGYGKSGVMGPASSRLLSMIGTPQIAAFNQEDPCSVPEIDQGRVSFMGKNIDQIRLQRRDPGFNPRYSLWTINLSDGEAINLHVQSGTTEYSFDPPQTNLLSGWHHYELYWQVAKYEDYYDTTPMGNGGRLYVYVDGRLLFGVEYEIGNQMGGISGSIGDDFELLRPNTILLGRTDDASATCYIDDYCVVLFGDRTYPDGEDAPTTWYPNTDLKEKQIKQVRVVSYAIDSEYETDGTGIFAPVTITNNAIAASALTPEQAIAPTTLLFSDGFYFMPNILSGVNASPYFGSGLSTAEPTTTPYYTYWVGDSAATAYDNKYVFAAGLTARVGHIYVSPNRTSSFRFRVHADAAIDNIQRGFPHKIISAGANGGLGKTSMVFSDAFIYARPGPEGNREVWSAAKIEGSKFGFERLNITETEPVSMVVESAWVSIALYEKDPPHTNIQVEIIG